MSDNAAWSAHFFIMTQQKVFKKIGSKINLVKMTCTPLVNLKIPVFNERPDSK